MLVTCQDPIRQDQFIPLETAVGPAAQELTKRKQENLVKLRDSVYRSAQARGEDNRRSVRALANLRPHWDSYAAPAPGRISIANAIRVLDLLEPLNLDPTRILPSAEGGVGICFVRGDRYADIECSNEGEILGVYYVGAQMPVLLETDATDASVNTALERIRDHIRG